MPPARPFFLSVLPYFLSVLPFFLSLLPTFLFVYLSFCSCSMLFPVDAFCVIQAWRGFWDVIVFLSARPPLTMAPMPTSCRSYVARSLRRMPYACEEKFFRAGGRENAGRYVAAFALPQPRHLGRVEQLFPALRMHVPGQICVRVPCIALRVPRRQRWQYDIKHLFFHVRSIGMSVNFTIFALIIECLS